MAEVGPLQIGSKIRQKSKAQLFLAYILFLLVLVGRPHFCLVEAFGLIVSLAISGAEIISVEVAINFSRYFLYKVVTSFQKYYIADIGSQVFSFSR